MGVQTQKTCPKGGGPKGGWGPKFRSFFSPAANFVLFFSLGVFQWDCGRYSRPWTTWSVRLGFPGVMLCELRRPTGRRFFFLESAFGVGIKRLEQLQKTGFKNFSLEISAMCGSRRIYGWLLVGMAMSSRLTAVQDGRSARATQACVPPRKKKKETLRASMRTHQKLSKNGVLRHRQLHAARSDRSEVFLPGQGLPRNERLQR